MRDRINAKMGEAQQVISAMLADTTMARNLERVAEACINSLRAGGKVLLAGN